MEIGAWSRAVVSIVPYLSEHIQVELDQKELEYRTLKKKTTELQAIEAKQQLRQKTLADHELQNLAQQYALAPELTAQLVDVMVSKIPTASQ